MADAGPLDTTYAVATPENIEFEFRVAGPFQRLPAYLIDVVVRVVVLVVLWITLLFLAAQIQVEFAFAALTIFVLLSWFVFEWFYGILFETYWNGQTPGKWLLGLRVVTADGRPINAVQAMIRNLLRLADLFPAMTLQLLFAMPQMHPIFSVPLGLVGLLSCMLNERYQRLGDIFAGTMVVSERQNWMLKVTPVDEPRAIQLAQYLPPNFEVNQTLAEALAMYVERRGFLSRARRFEIAAILGRPLIEKFGFPLDTSSDLVLLALYYRSFLQSEDGDEEQSLPPSPWGQSQPAVPGIEFGPVQAQPQAWPPTSGTSQPPGTPPAASWPR